MSRELRTDVGVPNPGSPEMTKDECLMMNERISRRLKSHSHVRMTNENNRRFLFLVEHAGWKLAN